MKRPKTHPKTGWLFRPVNFAPEDTGSGDDPAGGGGTDGGDGGDADKDGDGKKFTQADLKRIAAKEKAEGKRAAEKALADSLGVSLDEAKKIIAKHRETEDANKSEAEREREKAKQEREAAEAEKREAAAEKHEARIERALVAAGFSGDDKRLARVRKMVTVEVGASYDDVLADVNEAKTEFPELFTSKTPDDGKDKRDGKLPSSDPNGKPPPPKGGEDSYAAGQKRFAAKKAKRPTFNPLAKTT